LPPSPPPSPEPSLGAASSGGAHVGPSDASSGQAGDEAEPATTPDLTLVADQAEISDPESAVAAPPIHNPPAYGEVAARGMAWTALVAMWGKGAAFVTNLVLGWLLSKNDFGLYAIAVALTSIVVVISDGGTVRLLRRPDEFERLGRSVATISLSLMFLAAGAMAAMAFPAARFYDDPRLAWMILILAFNLPLGNRAYMLRTRLAADLRFRDVARVDAVMVTVRNLGTLVCAGLGFGPLSFVVPQVVATLVDWIILSRIYPGRLPGEKLDRPTLWMILHSSKWIALGMLAATIIHHSAPVVIRKFNPTEIVGIYFFGVQVAIAPTMLLATGLQKVLLPTMSRLSHDIPRQAAAYMKSLRLLALAASLLGVFAAVTAGPFTHLLWRGKWDESIPVIQLLSLALTFRMANSVGGAVLESRGKWRLRSTLQWVDAFTIVGAAAIGAVTQSMALVAASIGVQMTLMGVATCMIAGRQVLLPKRRILAALLPAQALAMAAGLVAWLVLEHAIPAWTPIARAAASVVLVGIALAAAFLLAMPQRLKEAWTGLRMGGMK